LCNTTGCNNTFFGRNAGCLVTTGVNNLIIGGYTGTAGISNMIHLKAGTNCLQVTGSGLFTVNGTNLTVDGVNPVGFRNVPPSGTKTTSYTLVTGDVGKYVQVGSGGSITIPNSVFAEGDVVMIANNDTASITITCTITDAYIAGTDTDKASVSLSTRGLASILFLSSTRCIISGTVS
jgi:hypothetical protein